MEEKTLMPICPMCGRNVKKVVRHHTDPTAKTKEAGALAKGDVEEKRSLLLICKKCHGKIHSKLEKFVEYRDPQGKKRKKKVGRRPYSDCPERAIWK